MPTVTTTQYNTHLFIDTSLGFAPEYEDALRRDGITSRLSSSQSDIVCLNEVWADASKDKIAKGVLGRFPHSYYPPTKEDPTKLGSGLLLLSKQPIVQPRFTKYSKLVGWDSFSQKGFIEARIMQGTEIWLRILMTHNQSGVKPDEVGARQSNFQQLYEAIRNTNLSDNKPFLIVGDLNVIAEETGGASTREYRDIATAFKSLGFVDFYRTRRQDATLSHGFTYNGPKNKLIPIFEPGDSRLQQRLDYMFVNEAGASITLETADVGYAYTYSDPKRNELMDLSDHYPLSCGFSK